MQIQEKMMRRKNELKGLKKGKRYYYKIEAVVEILKNKYCYTKPMIVSIKCR